MNDFKISISSGIKEDIFNKAAVVVVVVVVVKQIEAIT